MTVQNMKRLLENPHPPTPFPNNLTELNDAIDKNTKKRPTYVMGDFNARILKKSNELKSFPVRFVES